MKDPYSPQFKKSSFSSDRNPFSRCVEVAIEKDRVLVRHSKHISVVVEFTPEEWEAFTMGVKQNEFDLRK